MGSLDVSPVAALPSESLIPSRLFRQFRLIAAGHRIYQFAGCRQSPKGERRDFQLNDPNRTCR